jgi:acetyl esterase/lipase
VDGMSRDHRPIKHEPGLDITEIGIASRDGHLNLARVYRQTRIKAEFLPLYIYVHGGGFVTGSVETDDASCRAIAAAVPVVVLNVEYRLAPEHKFPVGFQDCHDIVKWVGVSRHGLIVLN